MSISAAQWWDHRLPVTLEGRDELPVITLSMGGLQPTEDNIRFAIFGAEFTSRSNGVHELIATDRAFGTDFEHSPSYVARMDFVDLKFVGHTADGIEMSGVLLEASYYGNGQDWASAKDEMLNPETCPDCQDHLTGLPYSPPAHDVRPIRTMIEIRYLSPADREAYLNARRDISTTLYEQARARRAARVARSEQDAR